MTSKSTSPDTSTHRSGKGGGDEAAVIAAIHAALCDLPDFADLKLEALSIVATAGMAHTHVAVEGRGVLVRIPRWSQTGLEPKAALAQEAAGFERAAASRHTPPLHARLDPNPGLAMGGLVVDRIEGRASVLPDDLDAIAQALAAIHALPIPIRRSRPPLPCPSDPINWLWQAINRNAGAFEGEHVPAQSRARLQAELDHARSLSLRWPMESVQRCLIGTDTHPGNAIIDGDGKAWFVDLEKAAYSTPAIDLAHATLYTSTTWPPGGVGLETGAIAGFVDTWRQHVPRGLAERTLPWLGLVRRLVWLRTLAWMARWLGEPDSPSRQGLDPDIIAHAEARIADFLDPDTIDHVRAQIEDLDTHEPRAAA